ncbi:unnamed protein product [Calicophoron daubneyi]|uniref:RH1 domain-containing protein n=1 Tax=Calicophoron daubneyi TaxID=300641 RepID=A0AAV2TTE8_CALDB
MFTSVDVYDAASSIGRECQLIVGEYGPDVLQHLMPKIISILEDLEACTIYCDWEKEEVGRLQRQAGDLRMDCRAQMETKAKSDKDLEELERSWYSETQKLLERVSKLEEENDHLAQQLAFEVQTENEAEREGETALEPSSPCNGADKPSVGSVVLAAARGRSSKVVHPLKSVPKQDDINKQQDFNAEMVSSVLSETEERLQLTEQENRAADLQLIGRLKECISGNYKCVRNLGRELLQVSASLEAAEEEVCRLARQSGHLMSLRAPHRRQTGQLVAEKARLEAELCLKERELAEMNDKLTKEVPTNSVAKPSSWNKKTVAGRETSDTALLPTVRLSLGQGIESADCAADTATSKVDPDMITSEELRHLLYERNELRCRLIELEEELRELEEENAKDPDVEGPIYAEPIEKLRPGWKEKPDIKTIFRRLLSRIADCSPELA